METRAETWAQEEKRANEYKNMEMKCLKTNGNGLVGQAMFHIQITNNVALAAAGSSLLIASEEI